jgi:hypothetical protein
MALYYPPTLLFGVIKNILLNYSTLKIHDVFIVNSIIATNQNLILGFHPHPHLVLHKWLGILFYKPLAVLKIKLLQKAKNCRGAIYYSQIIKNHANCQVFTLIYNYKIISTFLEMKFYRYSFNTNFINSKKPVINVGWQRRHFHLGLVLQFAIDFLL